MAARHLPPIVLLLGLALLSGACGSAMPSTPPGVASPGATTPGSTAATPGASASPALPPQFGNVFEIPDEPIAVTPTLDDAHKTERLIPVEGGQLTATAADGTTFTLYVPADALAAETVIRMTPVATLEGMPFGTDPHSVQLEPEGLHFFNFVTLTITPTVEIPVDQQILFSYQGAGENLTLALPAGDTPPIAIRLLHFSGAGVTTGTAAEVAQAQPRMGVDAEARITSAIAAELGLVRQAALLGTEYVAVGQVAIDAMLGRFEEEVVDPRVAAAGESCAAGTLAIETLLGAARQSSLLAPEAGETGPAVDPALVDTVTEECVEEEYERCRDQHVVQNIIPLWQGWVRKHALLGGTAASPALRTASAFVERCLRFTLEFESQVTLKAGGRDVTSAVKAELLVRFYPDDVTFTFAPFDELVSTSYVVNAPGCEVTPIVPDGRFRALEFQFIRGVRAPDDLVGYVADIVVDYIPGAMMESFEAVCPNGEFTMMLPVWSGAYLLLHADEAADGDLVGDFVATDWEILGGDLYALKEWTKAKEDWAEKGSFTLYHTPGPPPGPAGG